MKKILIKGYYGYHNLGDDFILYSLLKTVDQAAKENNEIYQVSVISEEDSYSQLFQKFKNLKCKIILEKKFRRFYKRMELMKCDYWIIGGGGLFPNEKSADFPSLLSSIQFAKRFHAKICIYGVDINSINIPENKIAWRKISELTDFIIVRNHKSYCLLKELECKNVKESVDITFGVETKEEHTNACSGLKKLGVEQGRYNLWAIPMPWFPNEYKEEIYGERYKKLLNNLSEIAKNEHLKNYTNVFLPFYYNMDMELIKDLVKQFEFPYVICDAEKELTLGEKRALFRFSNCNICMRFHSAMFSIYNEQVGVFISYSDKASNVIRLLGLEDYLVEYGIRNSADFYKEFDLNMQCVENIISHIFEGEKKTIHDIALKMKVRAQEAQKDLIQWLQ
jgi:polysaccharide pyruvyl transferase WcaK-like protein